MSLKPLGTPLPCPAQEDLSLSQGDQSLLTCPTQGALSLLPYLFQEDLRMSLKSLSTPLPRRCLE